MAIIQTHMVGLHSNGEGAQGFVARPDDDQQHPGLVLIQEWWGLEPHIKDLAQKLAVEGFYVIVPDLYHGRVATEPDDAMKAVMMLRDNLERALSEIGGAANFLKEQPQVEPKRVGIMGFCVGGLITYLAAEHNISDWAVAVPFYAGGYDPSPESVANVNIPIMAFYGDQDEGIPAEQREKIERIYREAGKDFTLNTYAAGHAFLNPAHGMGNEAAANAAWPVALDFLKKHLQREG